MVQWLRLCTSSVGGMGLIPGWGTKFPQAACMANNNNSKLIKNNLSRNFFKRIIGGINQ